VNEQHTLPMATKLEWLRAHLLALLDAHPHGSWNVQKITTKAMIGMQSAYDFNAIYGDPVRWCRCAVVDQEELPQDVDTTDDVHGGQVLVSHVFSVILQFGFIESDVFAGSTTSNFYDVLWSESPEGILFNLTTLGADVVEATGGQIVQIESPDEIAMPEFPVAIYGVEEDTLVHHCDFRITIT